MPGLEVGVHRGDLAAAPDQREHAAVGRLRRAELGAEVVIGRLRRLAHHDIEISDQTALTLLAAPEPGAVDAYTGGPGDLAAPGDAAAGADLAHGIHGPVADRHVQAHVVPVADGDALGGSAHQP